MKKFGIWILPVTILIILAAIISLRTYDNRTILVRAVNSLTSATAKNVRPKKFAAFPKIVDWNSLKFTLQRGSCFGTCPIYAVEIDGQGNVNYEGFGFVAILGKHTARVSPIAVRGLFEKFRKAEFFWLYDHYVAEITDNPEYRLVISFDSHTKAVIDYIGEDVGMPKAVTELEKEVDLVGGTEKWVRGNRQSVASLKLEHWDFASQKDANLQLLMGAAASGNEDLVRQLLAAGVSAKSRFACLGVQRASYDRNVPIVRLLLDAGAPLHADPLTKRTNNPSKKSDEGLDLGFGDEACDVLQYAAMGGNPAIVSLVLARHPDVNWSDHATDSYSAGENARTALMILANNSDWDYASQHGADYPASARLLIAAGAKVNVRDQDGNTPLILAARSPDVERVLLEAGADPYAKDREGRTALDHVRNDCLLDHKRCAVLEDWMAAHPKKGQ